LAFSENVSERISMQFMWRFTWWRYVVMGLVRWLPAALADRLAYHSGLAASLEHWARAAGDLDLARAARDALQRLEVRYAR
jgi:hypothetical protein